MLTSEKFSRSGFARCRRPAAWIVAAVALAWLAGCADPYVQLGHSSMEDLNKGLRLIQEHNLPLAKTFGLPPMAMTEVPDQTLNAAEKYFERARDESDAAVKSFDYELDHCDNCEGDRDRGELMLGQPGDDARTLIDWVDAATSLQTAEQLRVTGKDAAALSEAYVAYSTTDPSRVEWQDLDGDLRGASVHDAVVWDHYAALMEVMKIRLGPAAVANPRRLAANPLYWYQAAALEGYLYNADADFYSQKGNHADQDERARMKKESTQALKDLREALELGFRDWRRLATDGDFKDLRKLPEYRRLVAR